MHLAHAHSVGDGAANLNFKVAHSHWLAIVLLEGSECQYGRLIQTLSVDLDRVSHTANVQIRDDAERHTAQFSNWIFGWHSSANSLTNALISNRNPPLSNNFAQE